MTKDEKIINKVRKLLAMSKDTSSPEEAAIAARQARKLIDAYQISDLDLTSVTGDNMGSEDFGTGAKKVANAQSMVASAVGKLNDVVVIYFRNYETGTLDLRFNGFLVDAVCATEMMRYLEDEMYGQARKNCTGRTACHHYRMGFAVGIGDQVSEILLDRNQIKTATGTSLVVVKKQLVEAKYGVQRYSKTKTALPNSREYVEGYYQGKSTSLNRQVTETEKRKLTS